MGRNNGQSQFYSQNPFGIRNTGATLEHVVLTNSKQFFKSNFPNQPHTNEPTARWKDAAQNIIDDSKEGENLGEDDSADNCCNHKICWWSPPQDSLPVAFCSETSIHGFKFMGQRKRHLTERIFWLVAFSVSLGTAIYLIYEVFAKYRRSPVIVSFQSNEQDIDSIPFPAVTLCNMNKFPKSKVKVLEEIARDPYHKNYTDARQKLSFVRSVCNAEISFAKEFQYAYTRGRQKNIYNDTITEDSQNAMMDFILANTLPCTELIRLCILGEARINCSELFRPIMTNYGKCCVFNILPLPLLLKNPQNKGKDDGLLYENPVLGNAKDAERNWPRSELKEWQKWNYDDGFVLEKNSSKPWKQKRSGLPYGLSILIDPNTEEYFCPVSDSEGIKYILHTPLEMPHVMEFASVADLNKEILVEVHPDMTNAEDDIRNVDHDKRQCYFGKEKTLQFFGPYTGGNCIDECTAIVLGKSCNCTFFFMPRDNGVRICDNDPESIDFQCIEGALSDLQLHLKEKCGDCDTLCEDIAYNYETTIATLQNNTGLWGDVNRKKGMVIPNWANHKMSVIHIFFGSETTVPKYRKKLYGLTDLIANTGGVLGLCLGFSILSGAEVVYFVTMRAFWKYCRRRRKNKRVANRVVDTWTDKNKIIQVNPDSVPMYNGYQQAYSNHNQNYGAMYGSNLGYY